MTSPKVSIIIPIYNTEKYLRECLDSVINQTLTNIEIICVNDGSTDGSGAILQEYAKKDPRIKYINQSNGGYGSAMNTGFKQVSGQYIGIVEPDDFINPDMYLKLYQTAEKYQADIVKSNYTNFFDLPGDEKTPEPYINDWFTKSKKCPDSPFKITECADFLSFHPSIWSCIYRTDFIKKHNIDFQEIKGAGWADNLFQVKTFVLAKRIAYLDEAFYFYRRKNKDDAKDLKDFTIPFKRIEEIRNWLKTQNITDQAIDANLIKRELNYIQLALRSIDDIQLPEMVPYIEHYLEQTDLTPLMTSADCTSAHRKMMTALRRDIDSYCMSYRRKQSSYSLKNIFRKIRKNFS